MRVGNTLRTPDGRPVAGVRVTAQLVLASGFLAGDEAVVADAAAVTDAGGTWELDLTPNSLIQPDNTSYLVVEHVRGDEPTVQHQIIVPATGTEPLWVYDLLVVDPDALTPPAPLDVHQQNPGDPHAAAGYAKSTEYQAADAALQAAIDAEVAARTAAVAAEAAARADADTAEATARTAADAALQAALDAEAAARAAADLAEATARQAADDALTGDLAAETAARQAADTAETTARTNADNAEAATRAAADAALDSRVDQLEADVPAEAAARAAADTALDNRVTAIEGDYGTADGLATLGADGRIPSAQLPPVAMTEAFPVATEAAMLALTAQPGDVAIRSDLNRSFILRNPGDPAVLADWLELLTPTDAVLSVDGLTGAVALPSDAAPGTPSKRSLGVGGQQAAAGNDARLSDQRVPTDGSVTNAKVAAGAAIEESKLALTAYLPLSMVRVARATTGSIAGNGVAIIVLTWKQPTKDGAAPVATPFADTDYTVGGPSVHVDSSGNSLKIRRIDVLAADRIEVVVENVDPLTAHTGTVHATAIHD